LRLKVPNWQVMLSTARVIIPRFIDHFCRCPDANWRVVGCRAFVNLSRRCYHTDGTALCRMQNVLYIICIINTQVFLSYLLLHSQDANCSFRPFAVTALDVVYSSFVYTTFRKLHVFRNLAFCSLLARKSLIDFYAV
jgi:hypothetical protein